MTTIGYTTIEELARVLTLRGTLTTEQTDALTRVLTAAEVEINTEIDLDDETTLTADQEALAAEVQIERATEHWQQGASPFGILGIGDTGATYIARDSWDRHALKLAPLKDRWGLA